MQIIERSLTGPLNDDFFQRVEAAINPGGFKLQGFPTITSLEGQLYAGQTVTRKDSGLYKGFVPTVDLPPPLTKAKDMTLFRILSGSDDEAFSKLFEGAINDGWEPHGSLGLVPLNGKIGAARAVIKKAGDKVYREFRPTKVLFPDWQP